MSRRKDYIHSNFKKWSDSVTFCDRCGEELKPGKIVWLELSTTDGEYYNPKNFPIGHLSQGLYPFGISCAKKIQKI